MKQISLKQAAITGKSREQRCKALSFLKGASYTVVSFVTLAACSTQSTAPEISEECIPRAGLDAYVQRSIERKASHYEALDPAPGSIMFVGASLIEEGRWSELLGRDILNRGISAETSADLGKRLDTIISDRPATLLLNIGGNDLSRRDQTAEQVIASLDETLMRLRSGLPDTHILVSTILPRESRFASDIAAVNDALAEISARHGVHIVDPNEAMANESGALQARLTNDGTHLNALGYSIWANAITEALATG